MAQVRHYQKRLIENIVKIQFIIEYLFAKKFRVCSGTIKTNM